MKTKIVLSMLIGISMIIPLLIFLMLSEIFIEYPMKEILSLASIGIFAWLSVRLVRVSLITELPLIAFVSAEVFSVSFSWLGAMFFRGLIKGIEPFSEAFFIAHLKVTLFVFASVLASLVLIAVFMKTKGALLGKLRR